MYPAGSAAITYPVDIPGGCVRFRILGPLEVEAGDGLVNLGPRKQRSLFALLLINHNRVVSTDRILDELWGEDAEGKENALWVYVSRLRAALGDVSEEQILVTKDHGYSLVMDPGLLDAHEFEDLARRGSNLLRTDSEAAARDLSEALTLWKGHALEEFVYDEFARTEIVRLEELRTTCLENRIEADLKRGLSGELIGELERLVDEKPLDERPVSQLMLAQYRAGRQADALRSFERFRRGIGEDLGLDPSPELRRLEEQILLHDSRLQTRTLDRNAAVARAGIRGQNPFRGLEAFREEDSSLFFGRDRLVSDILRRLVDHPIVSVVGSSGCGKSSAVRSGVIPAVRKGAIPDSDSWLIAQMVPGSNPFAELEAALLRTSLDVPNSLREQLDGSPDEILRAVLRVSPAEDSHVVIVVDQFEELFTLCDSDTSNRFLTALVEAASDPHRRVRVVITLRADFYDRPLSHPRFGNVMGEGVVNVVSMAPEELEQAAAQPAARAGVRLEPGLEAALIGDVLGEPGALPLFQFALTDLFDRRVGDTLTLSSYREMGGIQGAVSRKAEQLYDRLTSRQKTVARQVFLRLVAISDSETKSRRRVEASELLGLHLEVTDLQAVLDSFGHQRLLAFDRNEVTGAPTVEVAHEALLEHWDRLAGWITEGMADVRHIVRITAAAGEWRESQRDSGFLLTGGRLDRYEQWATTSTMTLGRTESEYLNASITARDELLAEDEERAGREATTTRRAKRNAFGLVTVIIAIAFVGSYLLWAALQPEGPTVALMYRGSGDNSIDGLLQSGLARADQDLDIVAREYVAIAAVETQLREIAEAGTELIIAGLDYGFFIESVAEEFPDTTFVTMDPGSESELSNVYSISFADAEGAYLMGAIAAMKSQAGHIGIVGAWQSSFIEQFFGPFDAGARSVDPNIEVSIDWVSQRYSYSEGDGFVNPAQARDAALHLYELGADVVFHVANESGAGVHAAADEYSNNTGRQVWSIGVDVDEGFEAVDTVAEHVLTSMVKQFDSAIYETIRSFLDGSLEKRTIYGLADGGITYSEFGGFLADFEAEIAVVEQRIVDGDADLPLINALPSSFRSTPVQRIDIDLTGGQCTSTAMQPAVAGDTLSFRFSNRTNSPATFGLASVDRSKPHLGTSGGSFRQARPTRCEQNSRADPSARGWCFAGLVDPMSHRSLPPDSQSQTHRTSVIVLRSPALLLGHAPLPLLVNASPSG